MERKLTAILCADVYGYSRLTLPLPSIPSIAVLRFTNQSGDPQQDYFSDGISDQLINDLSRVPGLFVITRSSSFAYKGKSRWVWRISVV
jgi:TolB-like protein